MQIILLATGETEKLRPLTETIPSPMIPVANHPVITYAVEMVARQGFKQILVSLYHLAGSIEAYLGDGRRWGVHIDYVLQKEAWGTAGALKWAERSLTGVFMAIPADRIIDLDIEAVLAHHRARQSKATMALNATGSGERICLDADDRVTQDANNSMGARPLYSTGVYIFEPNVLQMIPARAPFDLDRQLLPALLDAGWPVYGYRMGGYWNPLASFQDFHKAQRACLYNAGGNQPVFDEKARSLEARQIAKGIWIGRNHVIHPSVRIAPPVYVGDNCQIGREVELGPGVIIGNHVVIDDEATIAQCTILDHTYVGRLVKIENRLVDKSLMIDIATDESTRVADPFLLGEAHPALVGNGLQRVWDTAVSLFLLLVKLPVLSLIGLVAWLATGRIFDRVTYLGTQPKSIGDGRSPELKTFSMLQFQTRRTDGAHTRFGRRLEKWELHRLPELWNVLKGDISLVGVKPLRPDEASQITEAWQQKRNEYQAGFTGLWYVQSARDSQLNETLIADTYYVATRTWHDDLKILWQTPAGWFKRARS